MQILLLGLLAPAHGRAGGGHGPFRREGVGDGFGLQRSRSGAPVSRPTAKKIPPPVPLAPARGLRGGSAVGRPAHGLPQAGCAACTRSSPQSPERRRLRGRRDIKRSDWRDGRATAIASHPARLRAWRVLGVAIWQVERAAQPIRAGQFAKRAFARSAMTLPAIPGHGRAASPQSPPRR